MLKTLLSIFWQPIEEQEVREIPNHTHNWEWVCDEKCDWRYFNIKGIDKAAGKTVTIEEALKIVYSQPNDPNAATLVLWHENGFNAAHKNVAHWKCSCKQKTKTYFFTEPTYVESVKKVFGTKKNYIFKSVDKLQISDNIKTP